MVVATYTRQQELRHPPNLSSGRSRIPDGAPPAHEKPVVTHRLVFTGSGGEYFRIWVVNLLLTIVTLGIYSAWAKVRRMRYFHRNTQLAGAVFDYHAEPKTILKGRVVALVLLIGYQYAYDQSILATVVLATLVAAVMPFMLARAYRFKLRNTSYRGVFFDFHGSLGQAYQYLTLFPVMLAVCAFFLWSVIASFGTRFTYDLILPRAILAGVLLAASLPVAHYLLKRFQHDNAYFGHTPTFFHAAPLQFYKIYGIALGMLLLGVVPAAKLTALSNQLLPALAHSRLGWLFGMAAHALSAYASYLFVRPFLDSRLQNLVWNHTEIGAHRFVSTASARQLLWLHTANLLLIVLTCGLYKPFAAVRLASYRVASVALVGDGDFDSVEANANGRRGGALGQEAGELFNFDIGL